MHHKKRFILLVFLSFCIDFISCVAQDFVSCSDPVEICYTHKDYFPNKVTIEHAKTVKISYNNTYVDMSVTDASGSIYLHRLVRCGCPVPLSSSEFQVIKIPPKRLFVNDGPSIAFLTHSIPQLDRIVAVGDPTYIYSESIRSRFSEGTSNAVLANRTDIDVSFISLNYVSAYKQANISIPYFANGESDEATPFGRSEWIKVFGLIFNAVDAANSKYEDIVSKYNKMTQIAWNAQRRPSVLLNYPYGSSWSLPSENQYITQILRDANVDYRFMNDGKNDTNLLTLPEILGNFSSARFLLLSGPFPPVVSSEMREFFQPEINPDGSENMDGKEINRALKSLASVQCANVWVQSKRVTEDLNANDYFEFGAIRPDLLLEDIVHAVHPEAESDNSTTFSFKMKDADSSEKGGSCPYNDLLGEAPIGMVYIDVELEVKGMDRFQIEDKLVDSVIPEVTRDKRIERNGIEVFFEKPQQLSTSVLVLRIMVKEESENSMLNDAATVQGSVQRALGSSAEVHLLQYESVNGESKMLKQGLGTRAISGIVLGCLGIALLCGLLLFLVGRKSGRKFGATETRDRFWREHGVRLADDVELREETSARME